MARDLFPTDRSPPVTCKSIFCAKVDLFGKGFVDLLCFITVGYPYAVFQ